MTRRPVHGVGYSTLELANSLVRNKMADELVFFVADRSLWARCTGACAAPGVKVVELPAVSRRARAARIVCEQLILPQQILTEKVEVVHAPAYVLPVRSRVPSVVTVHDLLAITHPELCKPGTRIHYGILMPYSVRRASKIITPSRVVKNQLCERFGVPECAVDVVLPGVRDDFANAPSHAVLERARVRYRLRDEFILFPGNLEPKKNLVRLIEAFHVAKRAGLAGELLLIGGRGWGTRLSKSVPAPWVRWLGYVPGEDVPLLYRLASEIVYPSVAEGFGLPVIEALATGTIVVASDVPAVREAGRNTVVLIDPLSISDIAEGLLRARQDSRLREELKDRGMKVAAQFSWERAARRTWQLYREVARQ